MKFNDLESFKGSCFFGSCVLWSGEVFLRRLQKTTIQLPLSLFVCGRFQFQQQTDIIVAII